MRAKNTDLKERAAMLEERGKARQDAVVAVKEAWRKDIDTSKEIKQLKKLDQVENYERGRAMHKLYKQVLIEKVIQKNAKAAKLKQNLETIKNKIQRAGIDRFKNEAKKMNQEYEEKMAAMKKDMEDDF